MFVNMGMGPDRNKFKLKKLSTLMDEKFIFENLLNGSLDYGKVIYISSEDEIPFCTKAEFDEISEYYIEKFNIKLYIYNHSMERN